MNGRDEIKKLRSFAALRMTAIFVILRSETTKNPRSFDSLAMTNGKY